MRNRGVAEMAQSHQNRIHASVSAFQSASEQLIAALERLNDDVATRAPQGMKNSWKRSGFGWNVCSSLSARSHCSQLPQRIKKVGFRSWGEGLTSSGGSSGCCAC